MNSFINLKSVKNKKYIRVRVNFTRRYEFVKNILHNIIQRRCTRCAAFYENIFNTSA